MNPLMFTGRRSAMQLSASIGVQAAPADGTTVYFGNAATISGTAAITRYYIQRAGTIVTARLNILVGGTLGTTEQGTAAIRLNNTTDTSISAVVQWDALFQTFVATGLSIAVVVGDYIEWKLVYPTWATNPTNVFYSGIALLES